MLLDDLRPKELIISQKLNPLSIKLSEISDLKITQIAAYKTYACNVDTNASISVMVSKVLYYYRKELSLTEVEIFVNVYNENTS